MEAAPASVGLSGDPTCPLGLGWAAGSYLEAEGQPGHLSTWAGLSLSLPGPQSHHVGKLWQRPQAAGRALTEVAAQPQEATTLPLLPGYSACSPMQVSGARAGPPQGRVPLCCGGRLGSGPKKKGRSLCSAQTLGIWASPAQWAASLPEGTDGQPTPMTRLSAWPGLTLPSSIANSWARRLLRRPPRQSHSQRGTS